MLGRNSKDADYELQELMREESNREKIQPI